MNYEELTAPCGIDCFNCELFEDNITDEIKKRINATYGVPEELIACAGCRQMKGKHFFLPNGCDTLKCVEEKQVTFCFECAEFPCKLLAPVADRADFYPHNMKVYNLGRIKNAGLESWARNESKEIRQRYFKGKFVVGKGQAD